jgi:cytochrome c
VTDAEDGRSGGRVDPSRASVTMAFEQAAGATTGGSTPGRRAAPSAGALDRMRESGCLACHGVAQASVGPAYERVGQRYAGRADATTYLMTKIATGSTGVWGDRVMPPFPALAPEVRRAMADYILSLGTGPAKLAPRGQIALNRHAAAAGGVYRLTATYADQPRNGVGPLADTAVVVLRPARIFTRDALDLRRIGLKAGPTPDGTQRVHATVYENDAVITLGRLDLTGVARVAFDLRSPPSRLPLSLELRTDSVSGPLVGRSDVTPAVGEQWYRHAVPVSATGERPLFVVVRSSAQGLGQWNPLVQIDALHFER